MTERILIFVMLITLLSMPSSSGGRSARSQSETGNALRICEAVEQTGGTAHEEGTGAEGLPSGISLSVLADSAATSPTTNGGVMVLTLRQLVFEPGDRSDSRQARGPLLYFVAHGTIDVSVQSEFETLNVGDSVIVPAQNNYAFLNSADEPAMLLRVALLPPDSEVTVGRGDPAETQSGDSGNPAPSESFRSDLLLSGDIPADDGPIHLFLACLTWTDVDADTGDLTNSGPIGAYVVGGNLLIGETGELGTDDCAAYQAGAAPRLRAGKPSPIVLMAGVMAEPTGWWVPTSSHDRLGSPSFRYDITCDDVPQSRSWNLIASNPATRSR